MARFPSTATTLLGVVALALSGCSLTGAEASAPTSTAPPDVVAYWADAGEGDLVAECIAELGRRSFSAEDLLTAADGGSVDVETDAQLDELVESCRAAHVSATEVRPELSIVGNDPNKFGDDPVLDELYLACGDGDGAACDELFDTAPVGSEYEEFGLTCGDRPDVVACSTLGDGDEADES